MLRARDALSSSFRFADDRPPLPTTTTCSQIVATQRAEALVDASATISRALRAFGAAADPPPLLSAAAANGGGPPQQRQQQRRRRLSLLCRAVAGLEAEARNADALLARTRAGVARWTAGAEAAKGAIDQSLALPEDG